MNGLLGFCMYTGGKKSSRTYCDTVAKETGNKLFFKAMR